MCYAVFRRNKNKKRSNKRQNPDFMLDCLYCKIPFIQNTGKQKFCSKKCCRYYGKKFLNHSIGVIKNKRKRDRGYSKPYIRYKKDFCEDCGFIPEHPCQLDVDHKDGNHSNNSEDNLQTLCANCHRLKTFINQDWQK